MWQARRLGWCSVLNLCLVTLALTSCTPGPSGSGGKAKKSIQNRGSDTMIEVAQAWSEAYHEANIEVSGGGSGVGISSLISGVVEIANSSRPMSEKETKEAKQRTGKTPVLFEVGYDALAVYVHKDNPLEELTLDQLKEIYRDGGKVNSWSDLGVSVPGCLDGKIVIVSRQNNSGTYEYFREHVLGKDGNFKLGTLDQSGSKDVVALVGKTPCAIGYSGMGYKVPGVKFVKVKGKDGGGVLPSISAVHDSSYPISRPLYMYTLGSPEDQVKEYIDWIRSNAGQGVLEKVGYVPLKPEHRSKAAGNAGTH